MERTTQQGKALAAWNQLCDALECPDLELTLSNFCTIYAHYRKCEVAGVRFERHFAAPMRILYRQVFHTDGDSDSDLSVDDGQEECYSDSDSSGGDVRQGRFGFRVGEAA